MVSSRRSIAFVNAAHVVDDILLFSIRGILY